MKRKVFAVLFILLIWSQVWPAPALDFIEAAKWGEINRIRKLLDKNSELLMSTDRGLGATALHWAAIYGRREVVKFLLTFKPDVNKQEQHGGTCMHWAAHYDDPQVIGWLLDRGAKIDHVNRYGRTPLLVAARRGCLKVIEVLLNRGADINTKLRDDSTALHIAAGNGHLQVIDILIKKGLNPDLKNKKGQTCKDLLFKRPKTVPIDKQVLKKYAGTYKTESKGHLIIKFEDNHLYYYAFGKDELLSLSPNKFITSAEVKFFTFLTDNTGEVTGLTYKIGTRHTPATKIE